MKIELGEEMSGPAGTAVEIRSILEDDDPPDFQGTIRSWFLSCPGQSPVWDKYLLSGIHLRPIEGVKPPVVRVAAASHEVMLCALNPEIDPRPEDPETWQPLVPINVMEQVHLDNDGQMMELLQLCAHAVVNGITWAEPPLSGQVEPWHTSLIRTTAHIRGEVHAGQEQE